MIDITNDKRDLFYLKSGNTDSYFKFNPLVVNGIGGFTTNKEDAAIFDKPFADFVISYAQQYLVTEKVER